MALIQCPACKQDVNDKASYCPICGYALKDKGHREAQDAKPDLTTVGAESKDENIDMSEKEPEPWVSENSASGVKVSESQVPVSEIKETSEDAVLGTSSAKANPDANQKKEAKPKEAASAQKDLFARKREICDAILFDPDKLNALIGKNGEYYSAEFKAIRSGQKGRFNIPAFLLNVGHTLYRKNLYIFLRWQLPWLIASFIVQILLWLSIGQIFDGGIVSGPAILITCTVLYIAVAIAGLVICIITGKRFNSVFMRQLESAILSSCTEQDTDVNVFLYNHMDLCRKWKCGAGFPLLYVAGSVTASLLIYFIGIQTVTFGTPDSAALWNLLSSDDGYGQTYEKEYDPYAGSNPDSTYGSEDSSNGVMGFDDELAASSVYYDASDLELAEYLEYYGDSLDNVIYIEERELNGEPYYVYQHQIDGHIFYVRETEPIDIYEGLPDSGLTHVWAYGGPVYDAAEWDE